jgi:hypothetical protein
VCGLSALAALIIGGLTVAGCAEPAETLPLTFPVAAEVLPSPTAEIGSDYGAATWALDPAFPAPDPTATTLHLLVWERACSSGAPTTGRMSPPEVASTGTTLTIRIGVRARPGPQTCPGPPGTPAILALAEPLAGRTLLDGGRSPVGPPSPGFIP